MADEDLFTSLNPYTQQLFLEARDLAEMEQKLDAIKLPFKVMQMFAYREGVAAWIVGDLRNLKLKRNPLIKRRKDNGSNNR